MEREVLHNMGGGPETVDKAMKFIHQAKARTRKGSGHELGELTTGLVPICALLASENLNNGEITEASAQPASCLNRAQFNKAYQILKTVLNENKASNKRVTCEDLLRKHVDHASTRLLEYCQEAQSQMKEHGMRSADVQTSAVACGIFVWVCDCARIKHIPTLDELASEYGIAPDPLRAFYTRLVKNLPELKRKIFQGTRAKAVAIPSPMKETPAATPRKSARPQRALLMKETPRKQGDTPSRHNQEPAVDDDQEETSFPETPTKRRKLDTASSSHRAAISLFESEIRGSSSRIKALALDGAQRPSGPSPSKGSPLKRTRVAEPESDVEMADAAEVQSESDGGGDDEPKTRRSFRRFRPVYLEQRQWGASDPRLKRVTTVLEAQKQKMIQSLGHPFHG